MCALDMKASKQVRPRLTELKGEINRLTVVAADVSTHPSMIEIQQAEKSIRI